MDSFLNWGSARLWLYLSKAVFFPWCAFFRFPMLEFVALSGLGGYLEGGPGSLTKAIFGDRASSMLQPEPFHLGSSYIEPDQNRVTLNEKTVRVEPKAMAVLLVLSERPGQTLSRDFLLREIWPDSFVEANALSRAISQLRKAFGDSSKRPQVIETIPKAGYRLMIAPSPQPAIESASQTQEQPQSRPSHKWVFVLTFSMFCLATLWVFTWADRPLAEMPNLTTRPLTSASGIEVRGVFSPNGNRVAYCQRSGQGDLGGVYIKYTDADSSLQVTSNANDRSPVWSHDGTALFFLRKKEASWRVFRVSATGGDEREVLQCGPGVAPFLLVMKNEFVFSKRADPGGPFKLYAQSPASGVLRQLTHPPKGSFGDVGAVLSPDGRLLSFLRKWSLETGDLWLMDLERKTTRQLTNDASDVAGHDWLASSQAIVLSSSRSGTYRLYRLEIENGHMTWLSQINSYDPGGPRLHYASSQMLYEEWFFDTNIWRRPLSSNKEAAPELLVSSSKWEQDPRFSSNGRRIAFSSNRSGNKEIWVCQADGSKPVRLTNFQNEPADLPRWSLDGRSLVFRVHDGRNSEIFSMNGDGGNLRQLSQWPSLETAPNWSRDGTQVYFASNRDGNWNIWRKGLNAEAPLKLTDHGGFQAAESPDGRQIIYTKVGRAGLWCKPLVGGPEREIPIPLAALDWGNWEVTDHGIYYLTRSKKGSPAVALFDLQTEISQTLCDLPVLPTAGGSAFTVAPDQGFFLISQVDQNESDLVLVEGIR